MFLEIGPQFATVLVGEVFHKHFANRRQVASYAGLSPSPFNSRSLIREQGISKAGNPPPTATEKPRLGFGEHRSIPEGLASLLLENAGPDGYTEAASSSEDC